MDSMFDSPIPEIRLVGGWSCPAFEESLSLRLVCKLGDFFFRLLFGIAVFLLEEAGELVLIAPEGCQVLVGQLAPLLLHHSRKLLPVTRELIPFQDVPPMAKEFSDVIAIGRPPALEGILVVPRSRTSLRTVLGADCRVGSRPEITAIERFVFATPSFRCGKNAASRRERTGVNIISTVSLISSGFERKKKPTRWNTPKVFDHVGLLVNGPPGNRGLPFI